MGYKIRDAQTMKIPYTAVVGDDEMADATVSVRKYGEEKSESEYVAMFVDSVAADIANFSRTGEAK
jgi:threonyl-tRNA synthetase